MLFVYNLFFLQWLRIARLFTNYCEIFSRILKTGSCTLRLQPRVRSSTSNLSQCLIDEKLNSSHNYSFKRRIRQISNHLKGIPLTVEKFSLAGLYCNNPLEITLFGIRVKYLILKGIESIVRSYLYGLLI